MDVRKQMEEKAEHLANQVIQLARDNIVVNMRFLDVALSRLVPQPRHGIAGAAVDGVYLYYDPVWLLECYKENRNYPVRLYLHMLFHQVFCHSFGCGLYEEAGLHVEETLIKQYLRNEQIAKEFGAYYDLYNKYKRNYHIEEILEGSWQEEGVIRAKAAAFNLR